MATQGGRKKLPAKTSVPSSDYYIPPLPLAVVRPAKSLEQDIMGWVFCCFLIACLLPLGAMLYLDILEAKHEVKEQVEKVEKLRRQVEQEKRKNDKT